MVKEPLQMMVNQLSKNLLLGLLPLFLLVGCSASLKIQSFHHNRPLQSEKIEQLLTRMVPKNELQQNVKTGIVNLRRGDYDKAIAIFQEGLRHDPSNGHLHFLNALAYHLGFLNGNAKMMNLARAGYLTALSFDESNYIAAYLLGQIYFHQKEYLAAQNQFSYGLLYDADNPYLLNALAIASYYSHDLETAQWASQRAYTVAPEDGESIRNLMFTQAATGQFGNQGALLQQFRQVSLKDSGNGDGYWGDMNIERTADRLNDWKVYYASADPSIFSTPSSDIVTYSTNDSTAAEGTEEHIVPQFSPTNDLRAKPASAKAGVNLPKMTNIDVVILRTEEVRSQAKGINLLDGLRTTLTGNLFSYDLYKNKLNGKSNNSETYSISPSLELMGLEYNLNIFNDGVNKAEILARPSLLATENSTSNFFSGGELHVQLSSNNSDGSLVDIPVGITLNVTPSFYDEDTLEVIVHAEHSFLEMQADEVGFTSFSQTTKTSVDATAVLKFGETLILSGLTERGTEKSKSGVPFLEDVPGVQYFFSRKEELDTKRSILILLTPRKTRYAKDTLTLEEIEHNMDLEKVHTDKLKKIEKIANTNLNTVIASLSKDSQFYRQFRTGDMALGFWDNDDSLFGALKRVMGFLYY